MSDLISSKYSINKKFDSSVVRSERVLEIAESFGLGLDDKEFVLFDHLELDINPGDVVYITGQSGSGKSVLLRELQEQMQQRGLKVANIDAVVFQDAPVIDQIGTSIADATKYLSIAGLNDAYLFIRKPAELSDGQKYRFRLAKMMEMGANVWTADEFAAVLDRTTAKVIAHNMQKIARIAGATLMVATTHTDMVADLAPNLYIEKRYREKIHIVQAPDGYQTPAGSSATLEGLA